MFTVHIIIPDEGVDLDGVDVVELLQGVLDLSLVGLDVDDEDEGVVLLDLLHGALSVERVDDDLVLIETGLVVDGLARVLGVASQRQGLGLAEGGRSPDLDLLVGVNLEHGRLVSKWFSYWSLRVLRAEVVRLVTYALQGGLRGGLGRGLALGSACM